MSDQLTKVAESEFERGIERYAEMLFSDCVGESAFEACLREHPEGYLQLQDLAERAMRACSWFARHVRAVTNPCRWSFMTSKNTSCAAATCTGTSRSITAIRCGGQGFDYVKHPGFYEYCRGLLADPDCPSELRGDKELMRDFPPRPLPGLKGISGAPLRPWSKGRMARPGHAKKFLQTRSTDAGADCGLRGRDGARAHWHIVSAALSAIREKQAGSSIWGHHWARGSRYPVGLARPGHLFRGHLKRAQK